MNTVLLPASAPDAVERAAAVIRAGGLVAIPTETVYGLGANGLDASAVRKIFAAKGRPQDNPLILHVASFDEVGAVCHDIPEQAKLLADRFWPGPLTMVLPCRDSVPRQTTAGLSTVAVRCPDNTVTRRLIRAAGVPIAAPSANISGKPSPTTAQHVLHDMDGRIELILDGGPCRVGVESTIVDLTGAVPQLLRPGGVTPEVLRELLGALAVDPAVTGELPPDATPRAPGMKYRHYAPAGEVIIVEGGAQQAANYVRRHFAPGDAVLCFTEELPLYEGLNPVAYGSSHTPETLARGLFAALRQFDSEGAGHIFARCPSGGGVAWAVQNRLKKAAGFHIVSGEADE